MVVLPRCWAEETFPEAERPPAPAIMSPEAFIVLLPVLRVMLPFAFTPGVTAVMPLLQPAVREALPVRVYLALAGADASFL